MGLRSLWLSWQEQLLHEEASDEDSKDSPPTFLPTHGLPASDMLDSTSKSFNFCNHLERIFKSWWNIYRVISIQRGDRKFGWQVMNRGVASNWLTHTHTHTHTCGKISYLAVFSGQRLQFVRCGLAPHYLLTVTQDSLVNWRPFALDKLTAQSNHPLSFFPVSGR